jgi:hypothetical protein
MSDQATNAEAQVLRLRPVHIAVAFVALLFAGRSAWTIISALTSENFLAALRIPKEHGLNQAQVNLVKAGLSLLLQLVVIGAHLVFYRRFSLNTVRRGFDAYRMRSGQSSMIADGVIAKLLAATLVGVALASVLLCQTMTDFILHRYLS